ncbi:importin subunit alpha-2-like [Tropilaelaps mercedesae]|uniref:Importin subunit alpha-2-like n=1 Tax=Tropilaelaps mercedesae TaxID=418985 RepID=A0A1V9XBQ6_9ACAR|nr:importin subunit alpha-2-like [Tropilaelaps mercedesae]
MNVRHIACSLVKIRSALTNPDNINLLIQAGFLLLLEECFDKNSLDISINGVWTLCNIACGDSEQTEQVIQYLPYLVQLLEAESSNPCLQAQCLWCLSNIAGDSVAHRDTVLRMVPLSLLKNLISERSPPELRENLAWLMGNIARQGPYGAGPGLLDRIFEVLNSVLSSIEACDCEVVSAVCRALLNVLHKMDEDNAVEALKTSNIVRRLVRHSMHFPPDMECSRRCFGDTIKLIADLLASDDETCQAFIDQGALGILSIVVHEELSGLYYHACFAIANVFACSPAQIQCAINHDLLTAAIHQLEHGNYRVQREAGIALCSFLGGARETQVLQAFNRGLVPPLVQQLRSLDARTVYDTLVSLFRLMKHANELGKLDECLQEMIDCGIEERIKTLEDYDSKHIAELAGLFHETLLKVKADINEFSDEVCFQIEGRWNDPGVDTVETAV